MSFSPTTPADDTYLTHSRPRTPLFMNPPGWSNQYRKLLAKETYRWPAEIFKTVTETQSG